ncbi:phosphonopyruvate decarboxylase [Dethiobacter alkaliphilus]|uniref:Phosphonopyruvate decarboxylase n=1 Tax=Dethiobacter alkaliphilus AHT 1 TaxID=555088 RepID=C0GGS7_DETAL|nr:phosphonopyruvate decarboxylase [Dethiobacter alkaliphilus]EEG77518.1 phosphonopyruvate decarboxylase [Dethiobacter alkaliphilus AHT 1]
MINPADFYNLLTNNNIRFYTGVPDSLLKDFCAYVTDHTPQDRNIIAANEGNAVGIAAGRYLALQEIGLVYMQNSGLGNVVNPLTSLTDPLVYSIPMLLLIGWRGEPGVKDEPQHAKQGEITLELLKTLGVEYDILPDNLLQAEAVLKRAMEYMTQKQAPFALVIRKDTFAPYALQSDYHAKCSLNREQALKLIVSKLGTDDIVVSTTGKTSRELYEYRRACGDTHEKDFLTVGSMGHSSQIALGIALAKPQRTVYCLDGDGAALMHLGAMAIVGEQAPANFKHVVLNNCAHDSVGGQPTAGDVVGFPMIAKACGYKTVLQAQSEEDIIAKTEELKQGAGPSFLEVKVNKGARKDLGRPKTTPIENKEAFIRFLSKD